MEKCFFQEKLGLRSKTWGKRLCFWSWKSSFWRNLKKRWKKEDQCTSIFHFADRPEVPYEVDLGRNSFPTKIGFQNSGDFMNFGRFFEKNVCPKSDPEVSGRCLGPSPTYYRLFSTYSKQKTPRLKNRFPGLSSQPALKQKETHKFLNLR